MTTENRSEELTKEGLEGASGYRERRHAGILVGYLDSLSTGDKPEVERLLREHPDLAADLQEDLRVLSRIHRALESPSD